MTYFAALPPLPHCDSTVRPLITTRTSLAAHAIFFDHVTILYCTGSYFLARLRMGVASGATDLTRVTCVLNSAHWQRVVMAAVYQKRKGLKRPRQFVDGSLKHKRSKWLVMALFWYTMNYKSVFIIYSWSPPCIACTSPKCQGPWWCVLLRLQYFYFIQCPVCYNLSDFCTVINIIVSSVVLSTPVLFYTHFSTTF